MPIDAGAQPLRSRDPHYPTPKGEYVHGVYTAEDVIYMHAYLLATPYPAFRNSRHSGLPSVSFIVREFERFVGPDIGIKQVMALITTTLDTKEWALVTFGIDL